MMPVSLTIITCPSCPVDVHHYHPCDGKTEAKEVTNAQCGICSAHEKSVNQSLVDNLMSVPDRACRVCGMKMQAGNEKAPQPIPEDKPSFTATSLFDPSAPPGVGPISGTAPPVDPPALNSDPPQTDTVTQVKRRRMPMTARKSVKRSGPVLKKEKKKHHAVCMARAINHGYSSDDSLNGIV